MPDNDKPPTTPVPDGAFDGGVVDCGNGVYGYIVSNVPVPGRASRARRALNRAMSAPARAREAFGRRR